MKKILLAISLLILVGCGYKPSAHYIKKVFDDTIFVDVRVSRAEPENAVYVKDALHRMVITRFKGKIVPKKEADDILIASYEGTEFSPVSYDSNGYITRYKVTVRMKFEMKTKKSTIKRSISAYVEEDIHASSTLSSSLRILAIRKGMEKALDQFLAFAASKGALAESEDDELNDLNSSNPETEVASFKAKR